MLLHGKALLSFLMHAGARRWPQMLHQQMYVLERAEGCPATVFCRRGWGSAGRNHQPLALPDWIILVNPELIAEFLKIREEAAALPGAILFMQEMQHDKPSLLPQPLPPATRINLDSEESAYRGLHSEPLWRSEAARLRAGVLSEGLYLRRSFRGSNALPPVGIAAKCYFLECYHASERVGQTVHEVLLTIKAL